MTLDDDDDDDSDVGHIIQKLKLCMRNVGVYAADSILAKDVHSIQSTYLSQPQP